MNTSTKSEMSAIREAMTKDPDYAWSWFCNVAMASIDEGMEYKAAQRAAARFMYNAFEQDMTKHLHWKAEWDKKPSAGAEAVEKRAEAIYTLMAIAAGKLAYPWEPGGNSDMQCRARDMAREEIQRATPRGEVEG